MELDCTKLTWWEMHQIILSVYKEMKRRNPIFINAYTPVMWEASERLREISGAEAINFTSEHGPKEPKRKGR